MTDNERNEIIALYMNGYNISDIAEHIECTENEVIEVLQSFQS